MYHFDNRLRDFIDSLDCILISGHTTQALGIITDEKCHWAAPSLSRAIGT